MSDSTDSYCWK